MILDLHAPVTFSQRYCVICPDLPYLVGQYELLKYSVNGEAHSLAAVWAAS